MLWDFLDGLEVVTLKASTSYRTTRHVSESLATIHMGHRPRPYQSHRNLSNRHPAGMVRSGEMLLSSLRLISLAVGTTMPRGRPVGRVHIDYTGFVTFTFYDPRL
jgi:hypothetical protein